MGIPKEHTFLPIPFEVIDQFEIKGRGTVLTGKSIWEFWNRDWMKPYYGSRQQFMIKGQLWEATIVGFETFAKLPGPHIGESMGVMIKDAVPISAL